MNNALLQHRILHYWNRRLIRRFFRRAFLPSRHNAVQGRALMAEQARRLTDIADASPEAALAALNSREQGLSHAEAEHIRTTAGHNEVAAEKPLSRLHHLWLCYWNPFNILLSVLAIVSDLTDDDRAAIIITAMVLLATLLRFVQERRSHTAAERLKAMVSNTATVLRLPDGTDAKDPAAQAMEATPDGSASDAGRPNFSQNQTDSECLPPQPEASLSCPGTVELPIRDLVPGDVIRLAAGDMLPADVRVLFAKDLFVIQAALTGESLPVEKHALRRNLDVAGPLEMENLCFMGTNVVSGTALAVVAATGRNTCFGALAERVTTEDRAPTAFQAGINRISWMLIRLMLCMTPLVFVINGLTKGDWLEAALFSLSIAVGLTPEMLPMIVTTTLARGAVALSKQKVVVKHLDAIQNFGAMDVLCTDKTGTLTQDKVLLERYTDVYGVVETRVLELAYLNSWFQTGLKNLLDVAVLEHAELLHAMQPSRDYHKVDEIPFDFSRRRMSVVVHKHGGPHLFICKGALKEMLSVCSRVWGEDDRTHALDAATLTRIESSVAEMSRDGMRVLAVAVKELPPERDVYTLADEADLTLMGYVAFLDPPKESAREAVLALNRGGVEVKVFTGDNELVTNKVCREVGLAVRAVYTGPELEKLSDIELAEAAETGTIFARLSPLQKEQLVLALRGRGHVVGFLGDGINDTAALHAADVGISVDTAVDIAKEAADLILLEKSLLVLEEGVFAGRKTFANMLKYIKMTLASNFGNVFSVLLASAFLPFLPMLPLHLLTQNLLYDCSQVGIPFDNVDDDQLTGPRRWEPESLIRFMLFFGPLSSLFDIATFLVMWFVFHADNVAQAGLFQSGWFIEGLLSQTLIIHMVRTNRIPFIQSRPGGVLACLTFLVACVGVFLPMGPAAPYFGLHPLPPAYFLWLLGILAGYFLLTQLMKSRYIRRYGRQ